MKNPKPASLSSSLLARLGEARSAGSSEEEPEAGSQSPPEPVTQPQHQEIAAPLSSDGNENDEAAPEQGGEPLIQEGASEEVLPVGERRARVTLAEWAQRSSREMADLGETESRERFVPHVAKDGTLRARVFLFVIVAAVLGSLLGLWLGRGERAAPPPGPAASTSQPTTQATSPIASRDVTVAPLGPAASRPAGAVSPQAATEAPQAAPQAQPAPSPAPAAAATLTGAYAVQLTATRSEVAAAQEWTRLAQQHAQLLGSVSHEIVRAEVEGRGTFYRLRVGGFDAESAAQELCTSLKSENQNCLVVKR